jgi:hypothetical protein
VLFAFQHVQRGQDGREWVAQLVPEHRQKVVLHRVGALGLGARRDYARLQPHALDGVANRAGQKQVFRLPLDEVFLSSEPHALDRHVEVVERAEYDDGRLWGQRTDARQCFGTVRIRQAQIQEHDLELFRVQPFERGVEGVHPDRQIALFVDFQQHLAQEARVPGLIFDEQNAARAHLPPSPFDARRTMLNQNSSIDCTTRTN